MPLGAIQVTCNDPPKYGPAMQQLLAFKAPPTAQAHGGFWRSNQYAPGTQCP